MSSYAAALRIVSRISRGAIAGLTLAVALPVGVHAQDVARKDTLIIDSTLERIGTPENYNPFLPTTTLQGGLHEVGFESLFYLNIESGELIPWLAESYTYNETNDQVVVKLRDGITWSDGVPFTSEDVVFTENMLKDNAGALGTWGVNAKARIKDVKAIDPLTVQFDLTSPNPYFIAGTFGVRVFQTNMIVPKHIWEGQDPKTFTNYDPSKGWPITTSPYKLVSSTPQGTVWDRRDDWWGAASGFHPLPAPQRVIFQTPGTEERRVAMLINNDIDTAYSLGKDSFEQVHARNPDVVTWFPEMPYAYTDAGPRRIGFNTSIPPFNDARVRWAVSYAIDRETLVDIAWEGMSRPIAWVAPSYAPLQAYFAGDEALFQEYPTTEYNLDKVAENMTAAGYTKDGAGFWADANGQRLTIDLVGQQSQADSSKAAPVVTEMLRRAGFDTQFRLLATSAFFDAVYQGRATIWMNGLSGGGVTEPYSTFEMFTSRHAAPIGETATGAFSRWTNAEYDEIVAEMGSIAPSDPAFKGLVSQALALWLPELPSVPLTDASLLAAYNNKYWKNWPTSDNNYMHPGFWWASALVSISKVEPAQ